MNWGPDQVSSIKVFASRALSAQARESYIQGLTRPFGDMYSYLAGISLLWPSCDPSPASTRRYGTAFCQTVNGA